jgi:hypothetical protein
MYTIDLRYRYLCGGAVIAIGFGLMASQPVTAAPLGLGAPAILAAAEDSSLVTEVQARRGVGVGRVGGIGLAGAAAAATYGSGYGYGSRYPSGYGAGFDFADGAVDYAYGGAEQCLQQQTVRRGGALRTGWVRVC